MLSSAPPGANDAGRRNSSLQVVTALQYAKRIPERIHCYRVTEDPLSPASTIGFSSPLRARDFPPAAIPSLSAASRV
jgi:hypothetical protein